MLRAALAGLVLFVSGFANAGLIVYTDRADWLSAVGVPTFEENFNSIQTDVNLDNSNTTLNTLNYSDSGYRFVTFDAITGENGSGTGIDNTSFLNLNGYNNNSSLTITLPEYAMAFGWDTFNYDFGDEISLITIDGVTFDAMSSGNNPYIGFFGVIATGNTIFNSVTVSASITLDNSIGTFNAFDNLAYKAAEVPEPSTLAIFALGLMGLASRRFKKQ